MAWIALGDEKARDENGSAERDAGDDAEDLELSITEERHDLWQVDVAGKVAQDTSYAEDDTSPGIGIFLLMGWRVVNDECTDAGLNYWNEPDA